MRLYLEKEKIEKEKDKHYLEVNLWSMGVVTFCAILLFNLVIFGTLFLIGILFTIISAVFFGA